MKTKKTADQNSIQNIIKEEIPSEFLKNIPGYLKGLFIIVIVAEFLRKVAFHDFGVPFFVLDAEPLLTTMSYGKIGTSIVILGFCGIVYTHFLSRIIRIITITIGVIFSIVMVIAICIQVAPKGDLRYISKDYRVYQRFMDDEGKTKYAEIYLSDKTIPYTYCLNEGITDICADSVEKLKLQMEK